MNEQPAKPTVQAKRQERDAALNKKYDEERKTRLEAEAARIEERRRAELYPDLLACQTMGAQLNTPDFLDWIADRLEHIHGENPNVDYIRSLRDRADAGRAAIARALPQGAPHEA